MEENKSTMEKPGAGWRKFAVAGASGVVLGFLVVAANGILGGPIQFNVRPPESNTFVVEAPGIDVRTSQFVKLGAIISTSEMVTPPPDPSSPTPPFVVRLPGPVRYQPIVLERIYKGADDLFNWRMRVEGGAVDKRDVTVTLLDAQHHTLRRVTLVAAFPSGWSMPEMGPDGKPGNEVITFIAEMVREEGTTP